MEEEEEAPRADSPGAQTARWQNAEEETTTRNICARRLSPSRHEWAGMPGNCWRRAHGAGAARPRAPRPEGRMPAPPRACRWQRHAASRTSLDWSAGTAGAATSISGRPSGCGHAGSATRCQRTSGRICSTVTDPSDPRSMAGQRSAGMPRRFHSMTDGARQPTIRATAEGPPSVSMMCSMRRC